MSFNSYYHTLNSVYLSAVHIRIPLKSVNYSSVFLKIVVTFLLIESFL